MNKSLACFWGILLNIGLLHSASATETKLSGFATVGVSYHDEKELQFHRDFSRELTEDQVSYANDSVLGLQLNTLFTDSLSAVVQVVYQNRVSDAINDYFEYAFLRYQASDNWSYRVGRTNLDVFLLSEYKSVGHAYLWARPIVEFYGPILAVSQLDGADVQYTERLSDGGLFHTNLAYGRSNGQIGHKEFLTKTEFNNVFALTFSYEKDNWLIRTSMAHAEIARFDSPLDQITQALNQVPLIVWPSAHAIAEQMIGEDRSGHYATLGYRYNDGTWQVMAELGHQNFNFPIFPAYYNGYISVGKTVNKLTYYGTASFIQSEGDGDIDLNLNEALVSRDAEVPLGLLQQAVHTAFKSAHVSQNSLGVGVRWDITPALAFKVQWDHTWLEAPGSPIWYTEPYIQQNREVNLVSLTLDMVF
jgi:hypothetical protein